MRLAKYDQKHDLIRENRSGNGVLSKPFFLAQSHSGKAKLSGQTEPLFQDDATRRMAASSSTLGTMSPVGVHQASETFDQEGECLGDLPLLLFSDRVYVQLN